MKIDKEQIVDLLKQHGDREQASAADRRLPDTVDPERPEHQELLEASGINPNDLISTVTGGFAL